MPQMLAWKNRQRLLNAQDEFTQLLPRIELHARIHLGTLQCVHARDDAIAEVVALAFKWYCRLRKRGKHPASFVSALADFAVRAVWNGRRLTGQESGKDVLSPLAQKRHGFRVERLASPHFSHEVLYGSVRGQRHLDAIEAQLQDDSLTPVPDQVAFRIDFRQWLKSRTDRDRRIIDDFMLSHETQMVARKYGLSPSRVSQLRREFRCDWERFLDHAETNESFRSIAKAA